MLKKIALLVSVGALVGAMGVQAFAGDERGPSRKRHKMPAVQPWNHAHTRHVDLYEKDPATWEVVEDGAWGKLHYARSGPLFKFTFNAHGMVPEADYTLIYYPDPWPGQGLICLGSGTADEFGNVHINNSLETGDLPAVYDDNFGVGAKVWLVLSSDVSCDTQRMELWNPAEYLFENELILFVSAALPGGPHPTHGRPDRTKTTMGLYERLEGDPEDVRGSGELYGCIKAQPAAGELLSVKTTLRYAVPETGFDVYVKIGEDHAAAQSNPLWMGEIYTDATGDAVAFWDVDVSMFTASQVYVQVVIVPVDESGTLGYATDTRPVLLTTEG